MVHFWSPGNPEDVKDMPKELVSITTAKWCSYLLLLGKFLIYFPNSVPVCLFRFWESGCFLLISEEHGIRNAVVGNMVYYNYVLSEKYLSK